MRTSESIDQISGALAKAQGQFKNAEKNKSVTVTMKSGGSYNYSYAELSEIFDVTRKPLSDNELSHIGSLGYIEGGGWTLTMRLMHSSGQWIESIYPLPQKIDPKVFASEITYGRRYLFTLLTGMASEEDTDSTPDDNAKGYDHKPKQKIAPTGNKSPVKPTGPTKQEIIDKIKIAVKEKELNNADVSDYIQHHFGQGKSANDLDAQSLMLVLEWVESIPDPRSLVK